MAEKLSKTARASMGDKGHRYGRFVPANVAGDPRWCGHQGRRRYRETPGGMYWICPKDDHRIKI